MKVDNKALHRPCNVSQRLPTFFDNNSLRRVTMTIPTQDGFALCVKPRNKAVVRTKIDTSTTPYLRRLEQNTKW